VCKSNINSENTHINRQINFLTALRLVQSTQRWLIKGVAVLTTLDTYSCTVYTEYKCVVSCFWTLHICILPSKLCRLSFWFSSKMSKHWRLPRFCCALLAGMLGCASRIWGLGDWSSHWNKQGRLIIELILSIQPTSWASRPL